MSVVLDKYFNNKESKNIVLFTIGYFISLCGSSLYTFTIGLYVLKLTGSAFSFATTLVLSTIPIIIINPFAGVLADRFDRKFLVVAMDFSNGILLLLLYLISKTYGLSVSLIYVSTFMINCLTAIFSISIDSAKPNMVSEGKLVNLNSIGKVISSMTLILGPFMGGLLFSFINIDVFIIINGISFVISAIIEMFLEFNLYGDKDKDDVKKESSFINDIREGFKYVMIKKDIISLIIIFVCINFSIGFSIQTPLPFVINNILNLGSTCYGIIQSAFAVGLIIGAIITKRYNKIMPLKKSLIFMSYLISICIFIMAIPIFPVTYFNSKTILTIYYSVLMSLIGIAIAIIDILFISYLQQNISNEYRGRVMSFEFSLVKTIVPIALIISGFLIDSIPVYILLVLGSIILFISSSIWYKKNTYCKVTNDNSENW
ncbi:MFS transporter [Abyssisolibacter fermentans]|uniref:MFS transporter n=1 Tax=Abyssisolibacter fermentans TaxID=1766203 RepID=UPI00082B3969|nr:MFS transporter [Abyssisolibacter fermentans]